MQGEGIPQISKRLTSAVGTFYTIEDIKNRDKKTAEQIGRELARKNRNAAIRNARTYTTAAENKGRVDSYERAEEMGIKLKKKWMATLDDRTRVEHRHLDGMTVAPDEDFEVDGYRIAYPGDPSAEPEMIYNCRCTLVSEIEGIKYEDERNTSKMGEMTYEEWKHAKDKEQPAEEAKPEINMDKMKQVMDEKDFNAFKDLVENAENRKLYEMYADEGRYIKDKSGGYFSPVGKTVHFSYEKEREGIDRFSTLTHENNHKFSFMIGRAENLSYKEIDLINEKCSGMIKVDRIKPLPSNSDEFLSALRKDMETLKPLLAPDENEFTHSKTTDIVEYFRGRSKFGYEVFQSRKDFNASSGVQDAVDGFFDHLGKLFGWGHGDRYYNDDYNKKFNGKEKELKAAFIELGFDASNQAKVKRLCRQYEAAEEAWANVGGAITTDGDELKMLEKYMPNTVEEYRRIVRDL